MGKRYENGSRRRRLRARLRAMALPCAICGGAIDYSLPAGDPMSFEVDEVLPVSLGGDPLDWDNLQPAHRCCNQEKGARVGFTLERPPCAGSKADGQGGMAAGRGPTLPAPSRPW